MRVFGRTSVLVLFLFFPLFFATAGEQAAIGLLKEKIEEIVTQNPGKLLLWEDIQRYLETSPKISFSNFEKIRGLSELEPYRDISKTSSELWLFDFTNDGIKDFVFTTVRGTSRCHQYEFFRVNDAGELDVYIGPDLFHLAWEEGGGLCNDSRWTPHIVQSFLVPITIDEKNYIVGWDTNGPYGRLYLYDLISADKQNYLALVGADFTRESVGIFEKMSDFFDEVNRNIEQ